MADVVPLRAPSASEDGGFGRYDLPVVFDDATGPGRLAARWHHDGTVGITVADGYGYGAASVPAEFRLAADDVLELVRVLVEGLNVPGPVRLGPPAQVLPLIPRTGPASG